ncbi:MAG: 2-amino-4-hydroxy-6-hydroxymethyldihydropteridine diphosphokinase [Ketobacteraceae bacterium]|nr:2-amino-4-hydroxy-6-hydroxymethyldihydropteridine diphosphokinase [Ketobacteraceae bacterium]
MISAYIGLGSNLGDSIATLQSALTALSLLPQSRLEAVSQFYQSRAIGPGEQPDYINAAVRLLTELTAESLLDELKRIESDHLRTRGTVRWTARTLDLDLLLYGYENINTERLTVPHPRIAERNFVLLPLHDLDPGLTFPNGVCLTDLVQQTPQTGITPLSDYPAYRVS